MRQNVLVTGASSGIGRMTARFFAAKGFHVLGTSLSSHPHEDRVEMLTLDVTSDDSIARCIGEVLTWAGQIDVLVNNAGVWQVGIAVEAQLSIVRTIFETNLFGVVRLTDAVLSGMRKRRAAGISISGCWRSGRWQHRILRGWQCVPNLRTCHIRFDAQPSFRVSTNQ